MSHEPLVTVLVPARDEAPHLRACIESIAAQDHPLDATEVIVVVDGASRDDTEVVAKDLLSAHDFAHIEVIVNPTGGTPSNLNTGLLHAAGEYLCRVDARSRIPVDYVRRCVAVLATRPEVVVVGGSQVAIEPRDDAIGIGIARALNNRWGMGWSRYRRDAASGPADTVYLGAFRTRDLRRVGGWDPALTTNQDFDLNRRLARGGIVWFEAGLPVAYVPRSSMAELYRQYVRFGRWKVRYWRHAQDAPRPRQIAMLAGVPLAAAGGVAALAQASPAVRVQLAALGLGGALAYEVLGSRRPRGDVRAHGWALVAGSLVAAGWLRGAWGELLTTRGTSDG